MYYIPKFDLHRIFFRNPTKSVKIETTFDKNIHKNILVDGRRYIPPEPTLLIIPTTYYVFV